MTNIDDIFNLLFTEEELNKYSRLIKTIKESPIHSKFNKSDSEALVDVYDWINSDDNKNISTHLLDILKKQLEDCVDISDNPVCQQGRIARIYQTLEKTDSKYDFSIINKQALTKEIYDKVAHITQQNQTPQQRIIGQELIKNIKKDYEHLTSTPEFEEIIDNAILVSLNNWD